ncbi:L-asparaginase [Gaeumannomyces tritici R3-111a-1]|uniref:asparaginase n=1 Tax=Gaeumannomyces tritici (strain R3-111a-1) TaxID=644352 RepID=J3P341_GAET3|nr:L-asparaginase [Gaeumannomyces tritici R3-111a-1]EJT74083.1 L-asparaginase [Gaeumannomyces tritici R3-111a-1]
MASGLPAMGQPTAPGRASPKSSYPESRVLIIITGGTICMQPSEDGLVPVNGFLEHAMAPRPSFNDLSPGQGNELHAYHNGKMLSLPSLRTPLSSYSRHIRYCALEFNPLLDSSSISSAGWAEIAQTVKENYRLFDGFVVLHGTDSLAYSASALSFMMSDLGKPVILTGSQASIFALQSDATDNLLGSLIIAGTFIIPEVCLFFHHTLYRGNRTTKVSASAFAAFDSPNFPPLAKVTSLGVDVNWSLVRRPTRIAGFQVKTYLDTQHVACIRIFPGIKPEMLDSVLHVEGLKGLILETFGMGNAPGGIDGSFTKVIRSAVERGIVIINVSQCTNGFVSPLYAPGTALGRAGVVFGQDLTTEGALTKLSYLLALEGLSYTEIVGMMAQSLRGEMTESAQPTFSHPGGSFMEGRSRQNSVGAGPKSPLTEVETRFTELGYAIQNGDLARVREMLASDEATGQQLLKRSDYAGNTAVHLAAVGPTAEVLRDLLMRGASVHVRNRANNTPLFLAEKMGNSGCVELLREAGAHLTEYEAEQQRQRQQQQNQQPSPKRQKTETN